VRLNPTTLTILTDAHKILSEETHRLGEAAAELFRRIEVLQADLKSKVEKANEVAQRVDEITGEDSQEDGPLKGANERIAERIQSAKSRQEYIAQQVDRIRRKVGRGTQRELSDREKAWFEEVSGLAAKILPPEAPTSSVKDKDPFAALSTSLAQSSLTPQPYERFDEAKNLSTELVQQAHEIGGENESGRSSAMGSSTGSVFGNSRRGARVSKGVRDQEIHEIKERLERQSEIVERTKERLERLIATVD
jgi:nucleoporin NUP82